MGSWNVGGHADYCSQRAAALESRADDVNVELLPVARPGSRCRRPARDELLAELAEAGIFLTEAFLAPTEVLRQCATADDCPALVAEEARSILRSAGLWPLLRPEAGGTS